MLPAMLRSRTARSLGALIGALALTASLPATAMADHDRRGWRDERQTDHGRRGDHHGRHDGHRWGHPAGFRTVRYGYAPHRHGPACARRPLYRDGYRLYRPYATFTWHGGYFGR